MNSEAIILVADDDPFIRNLHKTIFNDPRYSLHFASNGFETLTVAKQVIPDVILLDVMMPDMNGLEVCKRIRKDPVLTTVPIILITVLDDQESQLAGLKAGADDFISKPFNSQILKARVDTTIHLNRYKSLLAERQKFNWVIKILPDGIIILDCDLNIVLMNPPMLDLMAIKDETEFLGQPIISLFNPPQGLQLVQQCQKILIGKSQIERGQAMLQVTNSQKRYVEIVAGHFSWQDKPSILLIFHDISDLKRVEQSHKETEENFRILAEKSPNMIFINVHGRVLYANEQCETQMGYTREEYYAPSFDFLNLIAPQDRERIKSNFERHLQGEEMQPYEYSLVTRDNRILDVLITTRLITFKGERAILGIITDITSLKRTEMDLLQSLKEKDLLLSEIQHRVKNNLQLIMSLLRIQSRKTDEEKTQMMFQECQNRVMSL
ncbi:response regulator, partial [bacterium]|nr:response regulator [bacterium]